MGKVLDVLRQSSPVKAPAPAAARPEVVGTAEELGEGMPFIEVGPRRSITGSPEVLAAPAPRAQGLPLQPPSPLPRPHGVQFRVVPGRGPARVSRLAAELVAFHDPEGAAGREYCSLLTSLVAAAGTGKRLLFTGSRDGAGTTTVVLNLALTAARQGRQALVIDANLRRPTVATQLGLEDGPGLLDVLGQSCSVEEALAATEQDGLMVLRPGRPTALLAGADSVRGVLEELDGRFDLVLIDGPAWDGRTAALLADAADAVFLVAPGGEADGPPASELIRALPARGVRLVGCVVAGVP